MSRADGSVLGVILAAGKGTRLLPFSERYPKPILPILGKPLLQHQIECLRVQQLQSLAAVFGELDGVTEIFHRQRQFQPVG